jgi:hypothetical protein
VRVDNGDGAAREYWSEAAKGKQDSVMALPVRRMDCLDCHNRPTHTFQRPADEIDAALHSGRIARNLPYVKREGLALLRAEWLSKEAALASFDDSLVAFYRREHPEVAASRSHDIEAAATALGQIYARNVFPKMKVGWDTYPNMLGHRDDGGCFRCHDDLHATADGRTISQDCTTCHNLLAMQEENPPVLQTLYGGP